MTKRGTLYGLQGLPGAALAHPELLTALFPRKAYGGGSLFHPLLNQYAAWLVPQGVIDDNCYERAVSCDRVDFFFAQGVVNCLITLWGSFKMARGRLMRRRANDRPCRGFVCGGIVRSRL